MIVETKNSVKSIIAKNYIVDWLRNRFSDSKLLGFPHCALPSRNTKLTNKMIQYIHAKKNE